jgi:hypothetical protein
VKYTWIQFIKSIELPFIFVHQLTCSMSGGGGAALPGPNIEPSDYMTSGCKDYSTFPYQLDENVVGADLIRMTSGKVTITQRLQDDRFFLGNLLLQEFENIVNRQPFFLFQADGCQAVPQIARDVPCRG